MEYIAIILISFVIALVIWYITRNNKIIKVADNQVFNIRNSIDLTGLPVITLYQDDKKYNFMLDTGSNVCYLNKECDAVLGNYIGKDSFLSASNDGNECAVHSIHLNYDKFSFDFNIRVTDLSAAFASIKESYSVTLDGILGGDFLSNYSFVLDYAEYVVYRRKV